MFGCPCYQVNGKLFTFLVTNGIVMTQLSQADREALAYLPQTSFFRAGKKIAPKWLQVSIKNVRDLDGIMPFVRKSYESAWQKA